MSSALDRRQRANRSTTEQRAGREERMNAEQRQQFVNQWICHNVNRERPETWTAESRHMNRKEFRVLIQPMEIAG